MANAEQEKSVAESPSKSAAVRPQSEGERLAANRAANKKRKKMAHRRTLRRSNTTG